jgi:hypothetical protein
MALRVHLKLLRQYKVKRRNVGKPGMGVLQPGNLGADAADAGRVRQQCET